MLDVLMPKMGISVSEGTILEWRKQPGDWVEADETLADVTTDKVDVEIPSPATGRLARIVAEAGDTVDVGTTIAEIDSGARAGEAHPQEGDDEPAPAPPAPAEGETDRSGFFSPVVRRIADKHGVDLEQVQGTASAVASARRTCSPTSRPEAMASRRPQGRCTPSRRIGPRNRRRVEPVVIVDGDRREPMSTMRKAIARHMVDSRHTAAHCTTIVEVDMSRVAARRAQLKPVMAQRGVSLTYLAFVAAATVEALEHHPALNASVDGEEIVYHGDVNLGIAVALEDGLIVPVIDQAQRLSLEGLAASIVDLAERARSKRLSPDEVHGGTFTITNPGQFGAVLATPIINQPQVGILDLEAIVKRAVVVTDEGGNDSIAIRPMTYLPMSWDHRALDGAEAARFLSRIKARLEGWEVE